MPHRNENSDRNASLLSSVRRVAFQALALSLLVCFAFLTTLQTSYAGCGSEASSSTWLQLTDGEQFRFESFSEGTFVSKSHDPMQPCQSPSCKAKRNLDQSDSPWQAILLRLPKFIILDGDLIHCEPSLLKHSVSLTNEISRDGFLISIDRPPAIL